MKYAIIDIGSNTVRLSVYDCESDGSFRSVGGKKLAPGLAGYSEGGVLSDEGIRAARAALSELLALAEALGAAKENTFAFATASLRNVSNGRQAAEALALETGAAIDVLSGEEEAHFDFLGARPSTDAERGLIIDIGGGSSELIAFCGERAECSVSLPLGSLALAVRFVKGTIPTEEEFYTIRRESLARLRSDVPPIGRREDVCAVGGTLRNAARVCKATGGERDDAFTLAELRRTLAFLLANPDAAEECIADIAPDRVRSLLPGLAFFDAAAELYGCERVTISRGGVREGYLVGRVLTRRGRNENGETGLSL